MWADLIQDVSYAVRELRRAPGFTAVAVLTLALGIAVNTAIFTVVNATMLRPLPFHDPGRLVFLWDRTPDRHPNPLAPARTLDLGRQMTSFDGHAAIAHIGLTLTGGGEPEPLRRSSVSSAFFDVLGVLAIACANVASLLLGRGATRRPNRRATRIDPAALLR